MGEIIKFPDIHQPDRSFKTELRKVIDGELTSGEYVDNIRRKVSDQFGLPAEAGRKRMYERRKNAANQSVGSKILGLVWKKQ